MANTDRALRSLTRAEPMPHNGPELVRYMGGRERAAQILSGMDRGPTAAERRADPEGTRAAYNEWRAAQRQAQRWAKGERGAKRDPAAELSEAQKRRARTENRTRRRTAAGAAGIRAKLTARIVIPSPGKGRTDSRSRSISLGQDGRPGVLVEGSPEILQALADGDTELARELLLEGYLDGAGMPETTEVHAAEWTLWPDGEPEP